MKNAVEPFTPPERRTLAGLGLALVLALLVLFLGGLGQRRGYLNRFESEASVRNETAAAESARDSAKAEWQRWEQAGLDLVTLRRDYFYHQGEGIGRLRLDLQQLFNSLGITPLDMKFDYVDYDKDRAQKVTVGFTFSGSYNLLRRFLFAVERFPKLVFVERVDFVSVEARSGILNLKIAMAAYYEL